MLETEGTYRFVSSAKPNLTEAISSSFRTMATLQKFKLLATQCSITGSPSRSPTTSPVFQLRRRKTLKMFLTRSSSSRTSTTRLPPPPRPEEDSQSPSATDPPQEPLLRNKLKDLFVSSPPALEENQNFADKFRDNGQAIMDRIRKSASRRSGSGSPRPLSAAFRYRLLRRPWRPLLVTIPE